MKIATWNVNGIRARQTELQQFLEREQPDVLCLQEIKASLDQLPVWICDLEGYSCYWHGGKGYSGVAMQAKIQGKVEMRAVVLRDGQVGLVEVVKSLDPELDRQAVIALRQWEFKPGTRDGKPVAVRITTEMSFVLPK